MPVMQRNVTGAQRWWIDRSLLKPDGRTYRYRKVARNQTKRGALAEELRIVQHWERHGCVPSLDQLEGDSDVEHPTSIEQLPVLNIPKAPKPKKSQYTWDDAVEVYVRDGLPHLKPTTRARHQDRLGGPWMKHWTGKSLDQVDHDGVEAWELKMIAGGLAASTRRNDHLMVRVVLKRVGPRGGKPGLMLEALPEYPPLPKVGRTAVEAVDPEELQSLLANCRQVGLKVAIALAAYAGLRSGEVRALIRSDIDLVKRTITVSKSVGADEVTGTKSGHARVIPIGQNLLNVLEGHIAKIKAKDIVTRNAVGNEWGDNGLTIAYRRLAKRLKLKSTKHHSLRHHFATQLFGRAKADAVTVQHLLGHSSLVVTQRYAHHSHERAVAAIDAMD